MLAMGKPAWSVRMLAALAVLTMLFPWSDGLVMTKCDLKAQLEEEISQLQGENLADMIAKLVCTVERISAFNTSLVTITDYYDLMNQRYRRSATLLETRKRRSDPLNTEGSGMSGDGSGDESFYQYEGTQIPERSVDPIMDYDPYGFLPGEGKRKKRSIDGSKFQEVRKRRSASSSEEDSAMSGDGSGDESFYQYEGTQIPDRSVDPIMDYDPYGFLSGEGKRRKRSIDGSKLHQVRKRRSDPSSEEDSAMSGDGSGDESFYQYEGSQIPERSVDPIMDYDPYGFLSGEGKRKKRSIDGSKLQEVRTRRSDPSNGEDPIILQYYGTLDGPGGQASDRQTTFYGIFQLSDQACNSGSFYQDPDQCGLDCSDLIDDDITDDIACLMTLDKYVKPMTLAPECLSVDPSQYFTECD